MGLARSEIDDGGREFSTLLIKYLIKGFRDGKLQNPNEDYFAVDGIPIGAVKVDFNLDPNLTMISSKGIAEVNSNDGGLEQRVSDAVRLKRVDPIADYKGKDLSGVSFSGVKTVIAYYNEKTVFPSSNGNGTSQGVKVSSYEKLKEFQRYLENKGVRNVILIGPYNEARTMRDKIFLGYII